MQFNKRQGDLEKNRQESLKKWRGVNEGTKMGNQQMISPASAAGAAGFGSAGGQFPIISMEFYYGAFEGSIPSNFYNKDWWTELLQSDYDNLDQQVTGVSVSAQPGEYFMVSLYGLTEIILPQMMFSNNKNPSYSLRSFDDPTGIVKEVGYAAFCNCDNLIRVILPGCTYLWECAFAYCNSLEEINLPSLEATRGICFNQCYNLKSFIAPNCEYLGVDFGYDFYECYSLEYVYLPKCEVAYDATFMYCESLTEVHLPYLAVALDYCFQGCNSVQSFTFNTLYYAGFRAFYDCNSVHIFSADMLDEIDGEAFYGMTSMMNWYLPKLTTVNGSSTFRNCTLTSTIFIPKCTQLGDTTDEDDVFYGITSRNIKLTVKNTLMTCNEGPSPDGDIVYLQNNNTVNITTVQ